MAAAWVETVVTASVKSLKMTWGRGRKMRMSPWGKRNKPPGSEYCWGLLGGGEQDCEVKGQDGLQVASPRETTVIAESGCPARTSWWQQGWEPAFYSVVWAKLLSSQFSLFLRSICLLCRHLSCVFEGVETGKEIRYLLTWTLWKE